MGIGEVSGTPSGRLSNILWLITYHVPIYYAAMCVLMLQRFARVSGKGGKMEVMVFVRVVSLWLGRCLGTQWSRIGCDCVLGSDRIS